MISFGSDRASRGPLSYAGLSATALGDGSGLFFVLVPVVELVEYPRLIDHEFELDGKTHWRRSQPAS